MTEEIKRHEYKLPLANWLRDEINEVLSRYDVPSDVYERDVSIDAVCVVAVDKMERSLAETLDSKVVALEAKLAKAAGLLEVWIRVAAHCTIEEGVCCCGDSMDTHAEPMNCGHSPVDHGAHVARGLVEGTNALFAELTGGKDD